MSSFNTPKIFWNFFIIICHAAQVPHVFIPRTRLSKTLQNTNNVFSNTHSIMEKSSKNHKKKNVMSDSDSYDHTKSEIIGDSGSSVGGSGRGYFRRSMSLGKFTNVASLLSSSSEEINNVNKLKGDDNKKKSRKYKNKEDACKSGSGDEEDVHGNTKTKKKKKKKSKNLKDEEKSNSEPTPSSPHPYSNTSESAPTSPRKRSRRNHTPTPTTATTTTTTTSTSSKHDYTPTSTPIGGAYRRKEESNLVLHRQPPPSLPPLPVASPSSPSLLSRSTSSSSSVLADDTSKRCRKKNRQQQQQQHKKKSLTSNHDTQGSNNNSNNGVYGKPCLKVMIIGAPAIGKTSLCIRYCQNHFSSGSEAPKVTIGCDIHQKEVVRDDVIYNVLLYDYQGDPFGKLEWTADGYSLSRNLTSGGGGGGGEFESGDAFAALRWIDCLLMAYDSSKPHHMKDTLKLLTLSVSAIPYGLPIIFVGTKHDRLQKICTRSNKSEMLDDLKHHLKDITLNHAYPNFVTSAKKNHNVDLLFQKAINMAIQFKREKSTFGLEALGYFNNNSRDNNNNNRRGEHSKDKKKNDEKPLKSSKKPKDDDNDDDEEDQSCGNWLNWLYGTGDTTHTSSNYSSSSEQSNEYHGSTTTEEERTCWDNFSWF